MGNIKLEVDIPEEILKAARIQLDTASSEIRKLVAFELYREGVLTLGKMCEAADITKWEFFELNKKMQIPIHYTEMDFEKDKEFAGEDTI